MTAIASDVPPLREILAPYQRPNAWRSLAEIVMSGAPLAAIWFVAWLAVGAGLWWLGLRLSLPAAGFVVRLFMIQHDCGHRAFFKTPWLNDWTGRIVGIFTLTPYDCWRREHAIHHATSGDLDRRGIGAIETLTVEEYRALTPLKRFGYRLYRHPLVLRWMTGNIGVHHVHHVSSKIPFYRLQTVLKHHPNLKDVGRIRFFESIRLAGLSLWDEANQKLVSFSHARKMQPA